MLQVSESLEGGFHFFAVGVEESLIGWMGEVPIQAGRSSNVQQPIVHEANITTQRAPTEKW